MATLDPIAFDDTSDMREPDVEVTPDRFDPAKIPNIKVSDETLKRIATYLGDEIGKVKSGRAQLEAVWLEIQTMYEKMEVAESKDFPFEGSAALMMPVMATFVETIWAKITNTIFAPDDPFTSRPLRSDMVEASRTLRKFMTWCVREELDLERVGNSLFMELVKLGTCISKTIYIQDTEEIEQWDPVMKSWREMIIKTKDQPDVIHIPLPDVFFPLDAKSFYEARWKAHRVRLTWGEVSRRSENGMLEDIEKLENALKSKKNDYDEKRAENSGYTIPSTEEVELFEVWFEYALDSGDDRDPKHPAKDIPRKLIAWYSPDSNHIHRIQANWYPMQMDPFDACAYIPREHQVYGIGVGAMAMPFQKEISAMHNQRLDAATLANSNIIAIKPDSMVPLDLKVRPGMTVPMDDPRNDFVVIPLGRQFDSTVQEEQHTLGFLQQRVGINEYMQTAIGGPATSTVAIMQESTRRFDIVIRQIRSFLTRIMEKVLLLYQQYYPEGKAAMVLGPDGDFVEQIFALPPNSIKFGVAVSVTATTSATTKDLERQNKLALFNMMAQYFGQVSNYAMQANNPNLPPPLAALMNEIVEALTLLTGEILDDFDVRNREQFTTDLRNALLAGQAPAQPGAALGPPGNGGQPGMGDIQQLLAAASAGGGAATA